MCPSHFNWLSRKKIDSETTKTKTKPPTHTFLPVHTGHTVHTQTETLDDWGWYVDPDDSGTEIIFLTKTV